MQYITAVTLPAQLESRRRNLGNVLRLVHDRGPMRQVEISDHLGLTRGTGISLIEELVVLGLLEERAPEPQRHRGRPSPVLAPAGDVVVIATEIAAASARVDVVALGGTLVIGQDLPITPASLGPIRTLRHVVAAATELLEARPNLRVAGTAVAIHGAVDHRRHVLFAPNLGWVGADVGAIDGLLSSALPHVVPPAFVGNDADMGALGELRRGAGQGRRDFVYLSSERGVGGGLVVHGELVLGSSGLAGEVGHLKVGSGTRRCACGQRGCWETEIGAEAYERGTTASEVAEWLGRGLGLLIGTLQPEAVVLGGHLAELARTAGPVIDEAIRATCPPRLAAGVTIVPAQLGKDAALIGASEFAFEPLLTDPAAAGSGTGHALAG
jgi:predicted NBD/HSP70 family sugar kinase